jgi:uncharacterized protein YbjT (DUF2867 family)
MKLVVIGGTGLIGSKVVTELRAHGHEAVAASPNSGVNTLTGEGLVEALQGASVVVDVSSSPSFEEAAVLEFFETIPYSIVHATQFFEFVGRIADEATVDGTVRLPHVLFQPIAADDVATEVVKIAVGEPLNGMVEVAGPEQFRFDELIRHGLSARHDPRPVVADPRARYFGALLDEGTLVAGEAAHLATTRFDDWLARS